MKNLLLIFGVPISVLLGSFCCFAQGVKFEKALSWNELSANAERENKMIFIDCYATWCGPCKRMDREVFTDEAVAAAIEQNFIAAKFQMDSTKKDGPVVQARYADAARIAEKYGIKSYPSLLFLSPDGELLYRSGYETAGDFLLTINKALSGSENIKGLRQQFSKGMLNKEGLEKFIKLLRKSEMKPEAEKVALYYKENYLEKLPRDSMATLSNVQFLASYFPLFNSKDTFFQELLTNAPRFDSAYNRKGFAQSVTDYIIAREELNQKLRVNGKLIEGEPAWATYHNEIARKYGKPIADRLVRNKQVFWYYEKKNWPQVIKYYVEKLDEEGLDKTAMSVLQQNNFFYEVIFRHSEDKALLAKTAGWQKTMIDDNPGLFGLIDTYASLLYKLGKVEEAIQWEEKALQFAREQKDEKAIKFYEDILAKMKEGKGIW